MMQISEQMRVALGDASANKLIEIDQIASIIFDHMREVYRLRLEFCGSAVDRHAAETGPVTLAVMCGADFEFSDSMKLLEHRMHNVGGMLEQKTKELAEGLFDVVRRVSALEADLRRAQARVKEHPANDLGVRQQVFNMTDGRCFYCEVELSFDGLTPGAEFNVDHIMPRSSGGPDHLMNYVPSCGPCNVSKNAEHLVGFMRRRKHPRLKVVGGQE